MGLGAMAMTMVSVVAESLLARRSTVTASAEAVGRAQAAIGAVQVAVRDRLRGDDGLDALGGLEGGAGGARLDAVAAAVAEQLRADRALAAEVESRLENARSALDDLLALEAPTYPTQGGAQPLVRLRRA